MSQPAPISIREATRADLPFIVGLIHADAVGSSAEDPSDPLPPFYDAAFAAIEADPNQMLLVAESGGVPVGTFQLTFTPGIAARGRWRCTIEGVHVSPARRGAGIGAHMMEWAVETARSRGCGLVQLTSNNQREDAHRFYRRLDFSQSHFGFKLEI